MIYLPEPVEQAGKLKALANMDCSEPTAACNVAMPPLVLVVDDEPLVRFVAVELLIEEGFRVVEAGNVREALVLLEADDVPVDLVFSDIQMPGGLDGCDLARWVYDNRPGLPVILASGQIEDDALPSELRQLAPIIPKPYRGERLTRRIHSALGR